MALDYCNACGSLEQGFVPTGFADYIKTFGHPFVHPDHQEMDQKTCTQCGEIGTRTGMPEADECGLER